MLCHNHPDRQAVGVCKICARGLCPDCAVPGERDFVCSPACAEEAQQLRTIQQRAAMVYGIAGDAPSGLPTGVLAPVIMGAGFAGWGVYMRLGMGEKEMFGFFIFAGLLMCVGGFIAWLKYRRHGINV